MAKDKKGFVLYADQFELFKQLPNEKAGELIKHIFSYVNDENPSCDDDILEFAFFMVLRDMKIIDYLPRKIANQYLRKQNVRNYIIEKLGASCLNCGSEEDITLDHIIPVSKGGLNTLSNLQPLCRPCNSTKGTKTIDYRNN